jgi:hypothetical protein
LVERVTVKLKGKYPMLAVAQVIDTLMEELADKETEDAPPC